MKLRTATLLLFSTFIIYSSPSQGSSSGARRAVSGDTNVEPPTMGIALDTPESVDEKVEKKAPVEEAALPAFRGGEVSKAESQDKTPIRYALAAAIVAVMALGAFLFVRRSKSLGKIKRDGTEILVVAQHHFGPKRSVAVIKVAGESVLVGMTDENINLLKTLTILDEEDPSFPEALGVAEGAAESNGTDEEPFQSRDIAAWAKRAARMRL